MMKTVNDIYKYILDNDLTLLPINVTNDYWKEYISNNKMYDMLFNRLFFSFRYFLQFPDDDIKAVYERFTLDVFTHLLVNSKKYTELFKIESLDVAEYNPLNTVGIKETFERDYSRDKIDTYGIRNDSNTITNGSRTDSINNTIGAQSNSVTNTIAGFNSTGFENDSASTESIGSRSDSSTNVTGEQTISNNFSKGEQIDKEVNTDNENYVKNKTGFETYNPTDNIRKYNNYWDSWSFYNMIFRDISKALLVV